MTTDYDLIAQQYKKSKQHPWRAYIEAFTLLNLVGDLRDKSVLDVACGEGFYTRLLKQQGAKEVTGVDLSHAMIELARQQEAQQPLGVQYLVGDGRNLEVSAPCDLVVAAYLLNYARDRAELAAMAAGIARCLKPGGRFVTVNSSPLLDFTSAPSYRKYGFETSVAGPWREGAPITWTFFLDEGPFSIENYFLDAKAHEEALHAAGFREVRWHAPQLSPQGIPAGGQEFWQTFLAQSPVAFIECVK